MEKKEKKTDRENSKKLVEIVDLRKMNIVNLYMD
jgi:hypothetical protein